MKRESKVYIRVGNSSGLADSSGSVTASTNYDSFGNATNTSFPTRYQFTGREFDNFTGLTYYRARWYDANLGRFISEDPIGFAGGDVNLFGYVKNNPIMFTDPLGLFPENLSPSETQRRKAQCQAVKELLRREQEYGTGPAAWTSSVTLNKGVNDGGTGLTALNNRHNGDLLVGGRAFDIDWYMDSHAFSGNFSRILGPSAYVAGKSIWSAKNYFTGEPQTYYLPWQDPGELDAAVALSKGKGFKDIFDENWFEEYCPCE